MAENKKHVPMRRCIGCNASFPQSQIKRIFIRDEKLMIDEERAEHGRGVYICKSEECFEKALKKKSLERSFKRAISQEMKDSLKRELLDE